MLNDISIPELFSLAGFVRLVSLAISVFNERKLKKRNAIEYGKVNSIALVLLHTLFYLGCIGEAVLLDKQANSYSILGLALFIFSMAILGVVIYQLQGIWTVKLIIVPD